MKEGWGLSKVDKKCLVCNCEGLSSKLQHQCKPDSYVVCEHQQALCEHQQAQCEHPQVQCEHSRPSAPAGRWEAEAGECLDTESQFAWLYAGKPQRP